MLEDHFGRFEDSIGWPNETLLGQQICNQYCTQSSATQSNEAHRDRQTFY